MPGKIGFISLGCPKNTVDSEIMLSHLKKEGWDFTETLAEADAIVINTCAFIEPAREEAINAILEAAEYKKTGKCRRLTVTGCMVNRYGHELKKEIPEIDSFVDTFSLQDIKKAVKYESCDCVKEKIEKSNSIRETSEQWSSERVLITPHHYAYLKIADGCSHRCSFCAIPLIKGNQSSRNMNDIFEEAANLADKGVKELIIVSQDTTGWGKDLALPEKLVSLLRRIDSANLFRWIRLMYLYPSEIDDSLLDTIANSKTILPYFDIPLQHSDSELLKKMGRSGSGDTFLKLILRIKQKNPDAVIRSSFIVGFPGETDLTIQNLEDFLSKAGIDNVGVFTYSDEEGTTAHEKFSDEISLRQKNIWRKRLMKLQASISRKIVKGMIGKVMDVIVDGEHPESEYLLSGRFYGQAPEIDGSVIITEGFAYAGDIVKVEITETWEYDIAGRIV
jgi:ribosomal protein S12 methylthiotransferase